LGLEKIIDFILQFLKDFLPFFVVKQYEKAIVYRFGKVYKLRGEGIWFKIPFADDPEIHIYITTTLPTPVQTVITKDGKAVSIKAVIKYNIFDVVLYSTSIYDTVDALSDMTQGHIMIAVNRLTYEDCRDIEELNNTVSKKARADAKKNGIEVEQVTLTNFIETRNYRLFNECAF
jgi:regulator of protease activity HflC (stomatin/prohibitin superfamily)